MRWIQTGQLWIIGNDTQRNLRTVPGDGGADRNDLGAHSGRTGHVGVVAIVAGRGDDDHASLYGNCAGKRRWIILIAKACAQAHVDHIYPIVNGAVAVGVERIVDGIGGQIR